MQTAPFNSARRAAGRLSHDRVGQVVGPNVHTRALASAVDVLEGAGEPVPAEQIREHRPLLRQARERIDALLEEVEG
jgi:hypothetical protein